MTLIGFACTTASLNPRFRTPSWRPYRTAIFVAMGISAAIPVIHGIQLYGLSQMSDKIGLPWLALHGLLYIIGAGIYAVSHFLLYPNLLVSIPDSSPSFVSPISSLGE